MRLPGPEEEEGCVRCSCCEVAPGLRTMWSWGRRCVYVVLQYFDKHIPLQWLRYDFHIDQWSVTFQLNDLLSVAVLQSQVFFVSQLKFGTQLVSLWMSVLISVINVINSAKNCLFLYLVPFSFYVCYKWCYRAILSSSYWGVLWKMLYTPSSNEV
jgi:hypothetical protein